MMKNIKNQKSKIKNLEKADDAESGQASVEKKILQMSKSVTVKARYVKISSQKLNLIAKVVRRKDLPEVERILTFSRTKAAQMILKLLKSAKAAAVQKGLDPKRLHLAELLTQQGPSLKRGRPVSRGSYHSIAKKTAHLVLKLEE